MTGAEFDEMVRTFLDEQPRWLINGVSFLRLPDQDEPAMALSTDAMEAFTVWAKDKGVVGRPERVPELLALLDQLGRAR
jgi:hypothetical protein